MAEPDPNTVFEDLQDLDSNRAAAVLLRTATLRINKEVEGSISEAMSQELLGDIWQEMSETPELKE